MHRPIFETLCVEWRNSTPRFVLLLKRGKHNNLFPEIGNKPETLLFTVNSVPASNPYGHFLFVVLESVTSRSDRLSKCSVPSIVGIDCGLLKTYFA